MPRERLQKVLAQAGLGSRRACEDLILAGRVTVDGSVVAELGLRVDPQQADIRVDGQSVAPERLRYIMLHKPAGYLSGPDARAGYPSWTDLVHVPERLYAVGRLDQDSEGLLLLTNDGEMALRLMHPRYEHVKTYLVQVQGFPNARKVRRWQHGVMLDDGPTLPAQVSLVREPLSKGQRSQRAGPAGGKGPGEASRTQRTTWLKFTLREGRKRQVRRMVDLLGHPALQVIRVGLGPLRLDDLRRGHWRDLTPGEVRALREAVFHRADPSAAAADPERKTKSLIPTTIAIDGPSASGKSTIGVLLARELDYLYFDTGVMYRAVAAVALARGVPIGDEAAVTGLAETVRLDIVAPAIDDGRDVTVLADGLDITWDIRRREVEKAVSPVSAYPGVRKALCLQQRRIGEAGRIVMVGRDIGTVVLPDADLKIYLDATLAERARRRYLERVARGERVDIDQVRQDVRRRDEYDSTRQHAPLAAAADAIVVDSTDLTVEEVLESVVSLVRRARTRSQ